jgi:hypothetical protein
MNTILDDENIKNKIVKRVTTIFDEVFEKAKSLSKIKPDEFIEKGRKHFDKTDLMWALNDAIKAIYDAKITPDECDFEACNCHCEGQKLQTKVPNNSIEQVAVTINKQIFWRVEEYHNCFVGICDLLHLAAQAATLDELKEEIEYTMHDLIEDLYLSGGLTEYAKAVDLDIKISESKALSKNINEDTLLVKFCVPYTLSF